MSYRPSRRRRCPSHGGDPSGTVIPPWSPKSAMNSMDSMDSEKIATGILSLTAPSVRWNRSERREMAHRVNEHTANLRAKRTDRFGNFATLPFPTLVTLRGKVISQRRADCKTKSTWNSWFLLQLMKSLLRLPSQGITRPLWSYGSDTRTQRSRRPIGSRETVTMQKT